MLKYKKFLLLFAVFTILCWIPLVLNFLFIYRADEYTRYHDLVRGQVKKDALYGSALNCNNYFYKMELARVRRPEIIALGSSRILTLRQECFNHSFLNCGMGLMYLNQGRKFLEELFKFHVPKLVILGVDFWWFNDNYPQPETFPGDAIDQNTELIHKIKQPVFWWVEDKLSLRKYWDVLINGNTRNKITDFNNMGVSAIKTSDGFRTDGSYFQSDLIFGFKKDKDIPDIQFKWTLGMIKNAEGGFVYGKGVSQARLQEFKEIIQFCRQHRVEVVLYIYPVAATVYTKMAAMNHEYEFVDEVREVIKTLPVPAYDFHDIRDAGSGDCECIDGFHPGEVTHQKILLAILKQDPESLLKKYLNIPLLQEKVAEFDGYTLTKFDPSMYHYEEKDFLKLGCKKLARRPSGASLAKRPGD